MAQFKFTIFETRVIEMIYAVEADSLEEARELAERGETEEESFVRDLSVSNREIYEEISDA